MDHLDKMVEYTKSMINEFGWERIINMEKSSDACGCMGPRHGQPYCSCRMRHEMIKNLHIIVNEFDPEMAQVIVRKRLVEALGGKLL